MLIGVCEISLYLPNSHSLKDKRSILISYQNYLRKKYNISISEIDQRNLWKKSTIGIVSINSNRMVIDRLFGKIIKDTENQADIQLIDYTVSIN